MNTRTILGGVAISTVITGAVIYSVNKIRQKTGHGYFDDIIQNLKQQKQKDEDKECKCCDDCKCGYKCKCDSNNKCCDECKCDKDCNCEKDGCKCGDECKCDNCQCEDCECKKYPSNEVIKSE